MKSYPARFLIEELQQTKAVIENLDFLASRAERESDRKKLWKIRTELLEIFERDLELKRWDL